MIYCTNTLGISAAVIGTLMMISKVLSGKNKAIASHLYAVFRIFCAQSSQRGIRDIVHGIKYGSDQGIIHELPEEELREAAGLDRKKDEPGFFQGIVLLLKNK